MPRIALPQGVSVNCIVDDFVWPWDTATPVLMMHGFARNALFWNRWVPAVAETRRVYRPDLLGCGLSDQPPAGYRYTPEAIGAQIVAVLDALSLPLVHWVGESSGGIIGLLLAAAHPERIASLTLCNTPSRIPDRIKQIYALDRANASEAMLAPRASAHGAVRPSATGSTRTMPVRSCATGLYARWTARHARSPPRCTIVSSTSIPCRCCRASGRRCCCSAATRARSPRPSSRHFWMPCRMAAPNRSPGSATGSICCSPSAAPAPRWSSGETSEIDLLYRSLTDKTDLSPCETRMIL